MDPSPRKDVKTFYGILKVLLSLGPVFLLDMAANKERILYSIFHLDLAARFRTFPTTDSHLYSSLYLLPPSLRLSLHSRDAQENGNGDVYNHNIPYIHIFC